MAVFRCNRLIFVRPDRSVATTADKRLVTIVAPTDCGEFHLGIGNAEFRQRGPRQHIGHGIWRRYRDLPALEILNLCHLVGGKNSMRNHNPMAPKQLDIAALGVRGEDSLRSTLAAVEFARNLSLQGTLSVLQLENLYL